MCGASFHVFFHLDWLFTSHVFTLHFSIKPGGRVVMLIAWFLNSNHKLAIIFLVWAFPLFVVLDRKMYYHKLDHSWFLFKSGKFLLFQSSKRDFSVACVFSSIMFSEFSQSVKHNIFWNTNEILVFQCILFAFGTCKWR